MSWYQMKLYGTFGAPEKSPVVHEVSQIHDRGGDGVKLAPDADVQQVLAPLKTVIDA
jgi:hypothetical protein